MRRWSFFVYGVFSHLMFFAIYAWMAGFVGNFLVPKSIDSAPAANPWLAAGFDLLLIVGWGMQHSVMARPAFKRVWTRVVPEPVERSTYVLASNLALLFLFWQGRPLGGVVWNVEAPLASVLHVIGAAGWLTVLARVLPITPRDLFRVRQVW